MVLFLSIGTSACHGAATKGDFVSLCEKGSPKEISEAIKNGADVNVVDEYGRTPLIALAGQDRPEIVSLLIKAGAKIDYRDSDSKTPLMHHASDNLEVESSRLIVEAGADVNAKDNDGKSVLMHAVGTMVNYGEPELIPLFVGRGADINYKDPRGNTVLQHAAHTVNNLEFIQTLLDHGADPKTKNGGGATPLMAAASTSDENTVRFFLDLGLPVDEKDDQGFTAFMHASMCNDSPSQILPVLIAAGADVDATDNEGRTALMRVSENPYNPEIAKTLLELGANVNMRDRSGKTALDHAVAGGQSEEILRMLGKKPAVEYRPFDYRRASFEDYSQGTKLALMGEVSQIMGKNVLIKTRREPYIGYIEDPVYVIVGERVRALAQDLLAVQGTYQGLVKMEDMFGNIVSIPCIKADRYEARKPNLGDDMRDELMDDIMSIFQY